MQWRHTSGNGAPIPMGIQVQFLSFRLCARDKKESCSTAYSAGLCRRLMGRCEYRVSVWCSWRARLPFGMRQSFESACWDTGLWCNGSITVSKTVGWSSNLHWPARSGSARMMLEGAGYSNREWKCQARLATVLLGSTEMMGSFLAWKLHRKGRKFNRNQYIDKDGNRR